MRSAAPHTPPSRLRADVPQPESAGRILMDLALRVYCYLVVLLFLYVLSIGPMYWHIYEAFFLERRPLIGVFYLPLIVASEIEFIGDWLDWYVGLWVL
jgi:hypothetical protein